MPVNKQDSTPPTPILSYATRTDLPSSALSTLLFITLFLSLVQASPSTVRILFPQSHTWTPVVDDPIRLLWFFDLVALLPSAALLTATAAFLALRRRPIGPTLLPWSAGALLTCIAIENTCRLLANKSNLLALDLGGARILAESGYFFGTAALPLVAALLVAPHLRPAASPPHALRLWRWITLIILAVASCVIGLSAVAAFHLRSYSSDNTYVVLLACFGVATLPLLLTTAIALLGIRSMRRPIAASAVLFALGALCAQIGLIVTLLPHTTMNAPQFVTQEIAHALTSLAFALTILWVLRLRDVREKLDGTALLRHEFNPTSNPLNPTPVPAP